jgi:hypothetical protein
MEELKTIGGLAQLGSFGLLCTIAYWLMRYIPKHFEDLRAERKAVQEATIRVAEEHVKATSLLEAEHKEAIKNLIIEFAAQTKYEREECQRKHQEMLAVLTKSHDIMRQVRHEVANISQTRAMEKAAREAQQKKEGV